MGNYCPPKLNREYVKSPEGICKVAALVVGLFCWGLIYIGKVMSTSNVAPEINDQVIVCAAISLPVWILTIVTWILSAFARSEVIPYCFDAVLNFLFTIGFLACVCVTASHRPFVWICQTENDVNLVDTGECIPPDEEVLRNEGQNLAVVILCSVLMAIYAAAGIITCINLKKRKRQNAAKKSEMQPSLQDNL